MSTKVYVYSYGEYNVSSTIGISWYRYYG